MRTLFLTYLGLLALLTLTVTLSFAGLGNLGLVASLAIAWGKATLIMLFFMQLKQASTLIRVVAVAGFFWLAVLLSLSFSDYFFRQENITQPPHLSGPVLSGHR